MFTKGKEYVRILILWIILIWKGLVKKMVAYRSIYSICLHFILLPENTSRIVFLLGGESVLLQNFGPETTYCFFVTLSSASVSVSKQHSNGSLLATFFTSLEFLKYFVKYENFEQPEVCLQASWHSWGVPTLTHSWFWSKTNTWWSRKQGVSKWNKWNIRMQQKFKTLTLMIVFSIL